MPTDPLLLAIVPCEYIHVDAVSEQPSLVGVLGNVAAPGLPFTPPRGMSVYVVVTGVHTPVRVGVQLVTPDGSEVDIMDWHLPGGDPLTPYTNTGQGVRITYNVAGVYALRVTADGRMIAERRFNVYVP